VQVETLGDKVYMVAGGVPDRQLDHAERVAAVALEFRKKVTQIKVPDTNQLPIRIGMSASMIRYDEYLSYQLDASGGFYGEEGQEIELRNC